MDLTVKRPVIWRSNINEWKFSPHTQYLNVFVSNQLTGIIFDATRYKDAVKHGFAGGLPDFKNRYTETQYWVWWPREAASKGRSKGLDFSLVGQNN